MTSAGNSVNMKYVFLDKLDKAVYSYFISYTGLVQVMEIIHVDVCIHFDELRRSRDPMYKQWFHYGDKFQCTSAQF